MKAVLDLPDIDRHLLEGPTQVLAVLLQALPDAAHLLEPRRALRGEGLGGLGDRRAEPAEPLLLFAANLCQLSPQRGQSFHTRLSGMLLRRCNEFLLQLLLRRGNAAQFFDLCEFLLQRHQLDLGRILLLLHRRQHCPRVAGVPLRRRRRRGGRQLGPGVAHLLLQGVDGGVRLDEPRLRRSPLNLDLHKLLLDGVPVRPGVPELPAEGTRVGLRLVELLLQRSTLGSRLQIQRGGPLGRLAPLGRGAAADAATSDGYGRRNDWLEGGEEPLDVGQLASHGLCIALDVRQGSLAEWRPLILSDDSPPQLLHAVLHPREALLAGFREQGDDLQGPVDLGGDELL
mmetsp:Transcript_32322/g.83086  ORF Transcript_32322/g.83086 Transcript_32322/m.83086 type:complete len:343 (+) Transcript_32322:1297-2325(+)